MRFSIIQILLVASLVSAAGCQTAGPRQVVSEFNDNLKKKDVKALIPFVTNEPDYLILRTMKERRRKANVPEPTPVPASHRENGLGNPAPQKYEGGELVERAVPTALFFEQI